MVTQINQEELLHQAALLAADLYTEDLLSRGESFSKTTSPRLNTPEYQKTARTVNKELKKAQARKAICAALGSVKNDIREVTKVVGAALLPLVLSGVITLPVTPLAFAIAGLIVFDAGISAFCAEYKPESKD